MPQDNPQRHPARRNAGGMILSNLGTAVDFFTGDMNSHLKTSTDGGRGGRERVAAAYAKKYQEDRDINHNLAVHMHNQDDYSKAADLLDSAHQSVLAMHQMLNYNLGDKHPMTQRSADHVTEHAGLVESYKNKTGQKQRVVNEKFDDIMRNNNLNPNQFGE